MAMQFLYSSQILGAVGVTVSISKNTSLQHSPGECLQPTLLQKG